MKPIRVNVTARDCKLGKKGSACECPIARALSRKFKTFVAVTKEFANVGPAGPTIGLDEALGALVVRFDQGNGMKPFKFTVRRFEADVQNYLHAELG